MKNNRGFTLLEIMLTLFILTIVGMIMTAGLNRVMQTDARIKIKNQRLSELQFAILVMERDVQQIVNRSILTATGRTLPAVVLSDNQIELTTCNIKGLQRVVYQFANGELLRFTWNQLDRTTLSTGHRSVLLKQIESYEFKILPKDNFLTRNIQGKTAKPLNYQTVAIDVVLNGSGLGRIHRIFPLAVNSYENTA